VNATGTGRVAQIGGRDVAGKTGTAQANISLQNRALAASRGLDVRDHRWFVFFAPRDNPQVAGVIFAEHGGATGSATPIARHVLETFFAKRDGLPVPVLPGARTPPPAPEPAQPAPAAAPGAVSTSAAQRLRVSPPVALASAPAETPQ
jgi:membrane peptidoglycan carboxypeptidase